MYERDYYVAVARRMQKHESCVTSHEMNWDMSFRTSTYILTLLDKIILLF